MAEVVKVTLGQTPYRLVTLSVDELKQIIEALKSVRCEYCVGRPGLYEHSEQCENAMTLRRNLSATIENQETSETN